MRSRPVENPHFLEYQATILLCIAAAGLSILRLQGRDFGFLTLDYRHWPAEPWRLISACLLHGGYLHLGFNLYWTLRFGYVLEPIFGSLAMAGIFLLFGAGSSAVQWAFSNGSIGLSGLGYGLFGLCWALDRYHPNYRGILDQRTTGLFVAWFFFCVLASLGGMLPIANWAHGAGALFGGLLGSALSPYPKRRVPGRIGLAAIVLLTAFACTIGRPFLNHSDGRAWELAHDGYTALVRGDAQAAVEHLEASTRRDATSETAWHNLGVAYRRLERWEDAEAAFRREREVQGERPSEDRDEGSPLQRER